MKKILLSLSLSIIIAILSLGFTHPLYVSVSQIRYNQEAKTLEIACKIFVDDLEKTLKEQGAGDLYLGLDKEANTANDYIASYLEKNLQISVNNTKLSGVFLGKEVIDDVIWSYIEFSEVSYPTNFTINNTLLLDSFEDQQNIVHVKVMGTEKSLRLFKGRTQDDLSF